jgi:hypothetical protein
MNGYATNSDKYPQQNVEDIGMHKEWYGGIKHFKVKSGLF